MFFYMKLKLFQLNYIHFSWPAGYDLATLREYLLDEDICVEKVADTDSDKLLR